MAYLPEISSKYKKFQCFGKSNRMINPQKIIRALLVSLTIIIYHDSPC